MNIEFSDFEKCLNKVQKIIDFQDKIHVLCSSAYKDGLDCEIMFPTLIDEVVDLLSAATGDSSEWISYWLFDLDCGRKYEDGMITDADGNNIKLETVRDLWALLNEEKDKK